MFTGFLILLALATASAPQRGVEAIVLGIAQDGGVPHLGCRQKFCVSDTVAYVVEGPARKLLWLPDIDKWEKWDRRIEDVVKTVDFAFLDGTFFSAQEIPGRSLADIPHPLVPETAARLSADGRLKTRIAFIHLNHTNRLLWDPAAIRDLSERGFFVSREGERFRLDR